jgi:hypothetical protein
MHVIIQFRNVYCEMLETRWPLARRAPLLAASVPPLATCAILEAAAAKPLLTPPHARRLGPQPRSCTPSFPSDASLMSEGGGW